MSSYVSPKFTGEILDGAAWATFPSGHGLHGAAVSFAWRCSLPEGAAGAARVNHDHGGGGPWRRAVHGLSGRDQRSARFSSRGADAGAESQPIPVDPGQSSCWRSSLGSFYPQPRSERERELAQMLVVRLNDQLVWFGPQAFHPPGSGLSCRPSPATCDGRRPEPAAFSGRVMACAPIPLPPSAG